MCCICWYVLSFYYDLFYHGSLPSANQPLFKTRLFIYRSQTRTVLTLHATATWVALLIISANRTSCRSKSSSITKTYAFHGCASLLCATSRQMKNLGKPVMAINNDNNNKNNNNNYNNSNNNGMECASCKAQMTTTRAPSSFRNSLFYFNATMWSLFCVPSPTQPPLGRNLAIPALVLVFRLV